MKAVILNKPGGADQLRIGEYKKPVCGEEENPCKSKSNGS